MKKYYKISSKNRFISFISALILLIIIGIYILVQQISGLTETKDIENNEVKQVVTTQTAIKVEPMEVTEEAIAVQKVVVPEMPTYNITLSSELQSFTWNECLYFDVAYELELAILRSESGFDSQAVSYTGACRGMGQLNRTTAKGLAESLQIEDFDIYNAEHNISCSIYLVMQLRDYWRTEGYCEEDVVGLTLLSYNRGIAGCYEYIKNHDIYNDEYVNKVLNRKSQLEQYGTFIN